MFIADKVDLRLRSFKSAHVSYRKKMSLLKERVIPRNMSEP